MHIGFSIVPQVGKLGFSSVYVRETKSSFGFMAGGDIYFDLGQQVQLRSGLQYQWSGIDYVDLSPRFPGDEENGEFIPHRSYWKFDHTNHFVGIPLEVKIKPGRAMKANHFFLTGGCRVQFLVASSGNVSLFRSGEPQDQLKLSSFLFEQNEIWGFMTMGFGYEMEFGRSRLMINPVFDFPMSKNYKVETTARANGAQRFLGIRLAYQ
jgi:hypothetical protein